MPVLCTYLHLSSVGVDIGSSATRPKLVDDRYRNSITLFSPLRAGV